MVYSSVFFRFGYNKHQYFFGFNTIFFIDSLKGWLGGICQQIYPFQDCSNPYRNFFITNNGGEIWDTITTPLNDVIEIFFVNENTGYISSKDFIEPPPDYWYNKPYNIHKTTDGGLTWAQQTFLEDESILSIHCVSPDVCYAVGTNSLILKTTTGGANIVSEIKQDTDFNAYPNPFDNSTTVSFSINKLSKVNVYITNIYGQKVLLLHNQYTEPGNYEINLDGNTLQPGVYFCVMETKSGREVVKIIRKQSG